MSKGEAARLPGCRDRLLVSFFLSFLLFLLFLSFLSFLSFLLSLAKNGPERKVDGIRRDSEQARAWLIGGDAGLTMTAHTREASRAAGKREHRAARPLRAS